MNVTKLFTGSIKRVTLGLYLIQLFKAILSFFTVIISSAYFGASIERDVWLLSISIMTILGMLLFGPIFEIFRSKFTILKEKKGEEIALKSAGSLITYLTITSLIIIIAIEIYPIKICDLFSSDYSLYNREFLILMIRFFIPTILFTVLTSILTGILNVYKIYYIPEFITILSTIINVIIIVLFTREYGIYSLVISNYITNILMLIIMLTQLLKHKIQLLKNMNLKFMYTYDYIKFALPFYFNYLVAQILLLLEKIISTHLGIGSLSILDYARKFVAIPISVIQGTINSVLTTTLASTNIKEGDKSFVVEVNQFINTALIITLPIIVITTICSTEIVNLFLFRGKFEFTNIEPTSKALFWFGIGIISIIFYSTCAQALVAKGSNKTSAFISGTMGFIILALNLLLYKKYGIQILAFSWSISHLVSGILMYFALSSFYKKYLFFELIKKLSLIILVLLTTKIMYSIYLIWLNNNYKSDALLLLIFTIITSMIIELIILKLLKFSESESIKKIFLRLNFLR